jgi:hypothetical protein
MITAAELEHPGTRVHIPELGTVTVTALEAINGAPYSVLLRFTRDDGTPDRRVLHTDIEYDWDIVPVEHGSLHTAAGEYEETMVVDPANVRIADYTLLRRLGEASVFVPDDAETIDLKAMPEAEIKAAYEEWARKRGDQGAGYGYKPNDYAIFGRMFNLKASAPAAGGASLEGVEAFAMFTVSYNVKVEIIFEAYNRMIEASVDAYETPVDGDPIRIVLLDDADKKGCLYREVIEVVNRVTSEMWADFIALFQPLEHGSLHTAAGEYEESRRGAYEENRTTVSEIRGKTLYRSPRGGKGLPNLTATRSPTDEIQREDYNSVVFDILPFTIKIGRAEIAAVSISFAAKCFANAESENPYEEGAVKSLDGPPFYFLIITLRLRDARFNDIKVFVKRYFDASGTLCWTKPRNNLYQPFTFCPLADLEAMENRVFRDTVPRVHGFFLAMASGSVADLVHDERQMNLWKLFNPLIRELAAKPEVVKLEEPFKFVEHGELHTAAGEYEESKT